MELLVRRRIEIYGLWKIRTDKNGGRDRDWTCDPLDVNEVLSRWATRPTGSG